MSNFIITNRCNAHCAFCFAADTLRRKCREGDMSRTELLENRAFAGQEELRLLGGEPTLHPEFADFVRFGHEQGQRIIVFTNGIMPEEALTALCALTNEQCRVVVNMDAALSERDRARRAMVLRTLGKRAQPGTTLCSPAFDLQPLAECIREYSLYPALRLGLANPVWRGNNRALHPKQYAAVGQRLVEQSFMTAQYGVSLEPDCGFVRCMFGDRLDVLQNNGFVYESHCGPVPDVCVGGEAIPCFALAQLLKARREDFGNEEELRTWMEARLQPIRTFGIYSECAHCPYFETSECSGGCLSARLNRLR